ncbi:MAG: VCBS repeat-containing protein, partial [Bacteroides sp.]|nr:VCBS repeat-containing protein [Bacteroides sp.]
YGADGLFSSNTLFEWNKDFADYLPATYDRSVTQSPHKNFAEQVYIAADIDGDGISDLIGIFPYEQKVGNTTYYYKMVQVYGTEWNVDQWIITPNHNQWINTLKATYLLPADIDLDKNFKSYVSSNVAMRLNGTSRQWLIFPVFQKLNTLSQIGFYLLATSTGYYSFGYNLEASSEMPLTALGDFTNDSRDKFIYLEKGAKSGIYPGKIITIGVDSNNNLTSPSYVNFSASLPSKPEKMEIADFNGDGLIDILIAHQSGYKIYWNQGEALGNSFNETKTTTGTSFNGKCAAFEIGDFNGDGLPDIIFNQENSSIWKIALNNGNKGFTLTTYLV